MPKLTFSYDEDRDILTVEGIPFSGDYFRVIKGMRPDGEKIPIEITEMFFRDVIGPDDPIQGISPCHK